MKVILELKITRHKTPELSDSIWLESARLDSRQSAKYFFPIMQSSSHVIIIYNLRSVSQPQINMFMKLMSFNLGSLLLRGIPNKLLKSSLR
jgi:hypothetical protein